MTGTVWPRYHHVDKRGYSSPGTGTSEFSMCMSMHVCVVATCLSWDLCVHSVKTKGKGRQSKDLAFTLHLTLY